LKALRAFGVSPEALAEASAAVHAERKRSTVAVWPEHWHALCVFKGMATQWRVHVCPSGAVLHQGLDYAALPLVLACCRGMEQRQPLPRLMAQLQVMERAALARLNSTT